MLAHLLHVQTKLKVQFRNTCGMCRKSVAEYETAQKTKFASAETSAREWADVTAKANMHKGKWSEYWEQAKIAGDMGNEKVS